jgi:hydrogenase maturation protease
LNRDLVLGIGNLLLSDDGAGIHAVQHLVDNYDLPSSVRAIDGGTLSFSLAEYFETASSLIVFDAARLNEIPGTIRCLIGADMDQYLRFKRSSVHEVGLAELMDIARLTGHLPEKRALIAIQPAELGWGDRLSGRVADSMPRAVRIACGLLTDWLRVPPINPVIDIDKRFPVQEVI